MAVEFGIVIADFIHSQRSGSLVYQLLTGADSNRWWILGCHGLGVCDGAVASIGDLALRFSARSKDLAALDLGPAPPCDLSQERTKDTATSQTPSPWHPTDEKSFRGILVLILYQLVNERGEAAVVQNGQN